ncbi:unnamed protein product [Dibothriocephalus latus]|uniref:Uncharacterized protein n=1 Tax=Dibothriocephalus latus TaxID=60516 RepID=A0A3P7LZ62_DIBLA|nr:unnamed protein product [Dibothriocephalus latus]
MQWFKGSIFGAFRRDFLDFALHSPATQPLLGILFSDKGLVIPDEFFFQTVAFNPHLRAPGACRFLPLPTEVGMGYPATYALANVPPSRGLAGYVGNTGMRAFSFIR